MGATAKIATVAAAEAKRRTIRMTRRPMRHGTLALRNSLPEPLPLRLKQLVLGEAAGEAEEARMGDHPM